MPAQELLPEFRPVMSAYYDALTVLGMRLMRLLALTLNLPGEFFTDRFQQPLASLRPIHYSGRISQPNDVRRCCPAGCPSTFVCWLVLAPTAGTALVAVVMAAASPGHIPSYPGAPNPQWTC